MLADRETGDGVVFVFYNIGTLRKIRHFQPLPVLR